ncbi:hypothetical protein C5F59_038770 [Streptomyces sp. QL37]|uniref:hypothetical protein n=1 Tax=Streptomyces sp. QL37 TaxID=2093747 RepID=UPI000CF2081F|nr:hypothetical protein [Streptomyces sp. QL37]PPQ62027.1 hypothetical protein C5F59_39310 [Streptomyces sp. QL37]
MKETPQITLYSGTNYTGKSCVLPIDGYTYTLAATGLDKVASVKVSKWHQSPHILVVRLYVTPPSEREEEFGVDAPGTFKEDTADTGESAGAGWIKAEVVSGFPSGALEPDQLPERRIRDTIEA